MADRSSLPPVPSRAAEEHVIGAILLEPHRWDQVKDLKLENFGFPAHRAIWQTFIELAANGGIGDFDHVIEHLNSTSRLTVAGGVLAMRRLLDDTTTAATISHYADVLRATRHGPDPGGGTKPKRHGRARPLPPAQGLTLDGGTAQPSAYVEWQSLGLDCNGNGQPYPNDANVAAIISRHPQFAGRIWFDEFREEIWHSWRTDTPKQWTEEDETAALIWMQQQLKLPKLGVFSVRRAVAHVARLQRRNELTEWLESLTWDGTNRLDHWLSDFLGCVNDDRHQRYGRIWLLTMVARAFRPGAKVDTVPVLEGPMGRGKSAVIKILGGEYATALDEQFGSKDFLQCLRGKWLVEIPDLAGFRGRDHTAIISAISRDTDNYRASYAQYATDHPRRCVFTITTELTADYLQEDRGMRRFLPISCGNELFDFDGLKRSREQLFAEAVHRFKAGEPWWLPVDQDADVQRSRVSQHPWTDRVMSWVENLREVTSAEILTGALEIPVKDQTDGQKTIVGRILIAGGWVQLATTRKGERLRLWRKAF